MVSFSLSSICKVGKSYTFISPTFKEPILFRKDCLSFREIRTKKLFVHVLYAEQLICKLATKTVFWFVLLRSQTTVSDLNGCLEHDKRKVYFYLAWELKRM